MQVQNAQPQGLGRFSRLNAVPGQGPELFESLREIGSAQAGERGAIAHGGNEGRPVGEPDRLGLDDIGECPFGVAHLVFGHAEKRQRRAFAGRQSDTLAQGIARLPETAQLKQRGSTVKPPVGPSGTKRERLSIELRRLLGMGVERVGSAASQIVETRGLGNQWPHRQDAPQHGYRPSAKVVPHTGYRANCTAPRAAGSPAAMAASGRVTGCLAGPAGTR